MQTHAVAQHLTSNMQHSSHTMLAYIYDEFTLLARRPSISPSHSTPERPHAPNMQAPHSEAPKGANPLAKLSRVLQEKARGDFDRVFKGTAKTRKRLSDVEELLLFWNMDEADDQLEELEDALICADFGPRTALKIVDALREEILEGEATKQARREQKKGTKDVEGCNASGSGLSMAFNQ
jgi:signal recognition particle GTPase